jgi:hypothetical protein
MPLTKEVLEQFRSNDANYVEIFSEFLNETGDPNYLDDLLDLCESGGCPDENRDPEYRVHSVSRVDDLLVFECEVFFDEKFFGSGCPDMPTIITRTGTVTYEVDLHNGALRCLATPE